MTAEVDRLKATLSKLAERIGCQPEQIKWTCWMETFSFGAGPHGGPAGQMMTEFKVFGFEHEREDGTWDRQLCCDGVWKRWSWTDRTWYRPQTPSRGGATSRRLVAAAPATTFDGEMPVPTSTLPPNVKLGTSSCGPVG